jgi:hypothetical protein
MLEHPLGVYCNSHVLRLFTTFVLFNLNLQWLVTKNT